MILLAGCVAIVSAQPRRVIPGQEPDRPIDAGTGKQVVETTTEKLAGFYVSPDAGRKMAAHLLEKLRIGGYDGIQSSATLAKVLTDDIHSVSNDPHTSVLYSYGIIHEPPPATPQAAVKPPAGAIRANFGFRRLEILDGNVGYVDLQGFFNPDFSGDMAATAMNFVANTDALIVDLRKNRGGDGGMVNLLSSYFLWMRLTSPTVTKGKARPGEIWTRPTVPGARYLSKPVLILTSHETFSAAEGFAYGLQSVRRAVIVGERTAGGAYGGGRRSINEHFDLLLSTSRTINAVTKTDWEGNGVEPDVPVPAK